MLITSWGSGTVRSTQDHCIHVVDLVSCHNYGNRIPAESEVGGLIDNEMLTIDTDC